MTGQPVFHLDTPLARGMCQLFQKMVDRLMLERPLMVYLAGGMAVHLYTGERVTTDVDAEYGARIPVPTDIGVEIDEPDGKKRLIYFDANYNGSFALTHEDYLDDAIPVDIGIDMIRLHVLSPLDLAVRKISRFAGNDQQDIAALVRMKLTTADAIEARANEALGAFVGGVSMLKLNIRDAVALAREVEASR
ncbi:MAG: DUF6036 family nucleotidyltransferase [Lautropia sp.]|nr:DUF6036 family nucleotidyltransferase [Lautropia sp.]